MNILDILRILMDVIDRRDRAMNGENIDDLDVDEELRKDKNIFCLRAKL